MQHISDKVEEWAEEKAVLLEQINDLRARSDLKCNEIVQYSRQLRLVLKGVGVGGEWGWKKKAMKTLINW